LKIGGLEEIGRRNDRKSEKLYAFLDQSKLYSAPVAKEFRSRMNVDFRVRAGTLRLCVCAHAHCE
jgi:phosphoserine aminotransferase